MIRYLLALIVCSSLSQALHAEVKPADNTKLKELLAAGVPLIDVRTPTEWKQTGVVEGSHLLTFFDEKGNYDLEKFMSQLGDIAAPSEPVAFICAVGGRTTTITRFLDQKMDYQQVHNVTSGIARWIDKGNPTVAPEQ